MNSMRSKFHASIFLWMKQRGLLDAHACGDSDATMNWLETTTRFDGRLSETKMCPMLEDFADHCFEYGYMVRDTSFTEGDKMKTNDKVQFTVTVWVGDTMNLGNKRVIQNVVDYPTIDDGFLQVYTADGSHFSYAANDVREYTVVAEHGMTPLDQRELITDSGTPNFPNWTVTSQGTPPNTVYHVNG